MMHSKRHRVRSPTQWLAQNPFLTAAILAGLSLAALMTETGNERVMRMAWQTLGYGYHATADLLSRMLSELPDWITIAMTAVVGTLLYLLLDTIWRRLKPE
jgi:hypothetical protein